MQQLLFSSPMGEELGWRGFVQPRRTCRSSLSLFIFGIVAYRRDWLSQLPIKTGMVWLAIGLSAAALPYTISILRSLRSIEIDPFDGGGLSLGAVVWSTTEALICVGVCVGLLTVFREHANQQGAL